MSLNGILKEGIAGFETKSQMIGSGEVKNEEAQKKSVYSFYLSDYGGIIFLLEGHS